MKLKENILLKYLLIDKEQKITLHITFESRKLIPNSSLFSYSGND